MTLATTPQYIAYDVRVYDRLDVRNRSKESICSSIKQFPDTISQTIGSQNDDPIEITKKQFQRPIKEGKANALAFQYQGKLENGVFSVHKVAFTFYSI